MHLLNQRENMIREELTDDNFAILLDVVYKATWSKPDDRESLMLKQTEP